MRVCLVSLNALPALSPEHQHLYAGGAEVQLAQLAIALARLGHEVTLIVHDLGQRDGTVYQGVRTLKAYAPNSGLPGLRFLHPRWTGLWSAIRRADAEVYYHSCAGMVLGLLALFCRAHRRRLVFRVASDSDCNPSEVLIDHRRDKWLYAFGLQRADVVLVQSASQQTAMLTHYGRHATMVRSLVEYPHAGAGPIAKDIDVLWVANLRRLKRPDRFLELARSLPGYRFHMAGGPVPGEESYFAEMQSLATSVPNVTFHGKVPYMEIGRLFDRARIVSNTSEIEGFPNTFVQAWVRGVPVVTMFDPDNLVARNALGSAHATVVDMVSGVRSLLESQETYRRTSALAVDFVAHHFGSESVIQPYLDALSGEASSVDPRLSNPTDATTLRPPHPSR